MNFTGPCGEYFPAHAENVPRILVIDDEPLVRWSLTAGLRLAGFDAAAAADSAQALALARQPPVPDLLLLDIRLWDADPRQLLEEIRALSPECRLLILAVVGQEVALPPWDGVDVIRKPFDLDEVVRQVESALRRRVPDGRMAL
jgi:DNA-binding response OmpR family regulator